VRFEYFQLRCVPEDHPPYVFFRDGQLARATLETDDDAERKTCLEIVPVLVEFVSPAAGTLTLFAVIGPERQPEVLLSDQQEAEQAAGWMASELPGLTFGTKRVCVRVQELRR
jgi:hypothetical protein